jgi:hypothetical protein
MVFSLKLKRTNAMRDVWQGPFTLAGKTVEVVNSVKILYWGKLSLMNTMMMTICKQKK